MHILVTNDDGINAEGIQSLKSQLEKDPNIKLSIIAPNLEQSSTGHKITTCTNQKPIIITKHSKNIYSINGSPADCIRIGLYKLFKNVDLVISGINHGANLGMDIYYSGTIAAAREACFYKIPSIALSLYKNKENQHLNFSTACKYTKKLINTLKKVIEKDIYLNINFPNLKPKEIKGIKVCKLEEKIFYNIEIIERTSPINQNYCWIHGKPQYKTAKENTDINLITKGFITITPLKLDSTASPYISLIDKEIKNIKLD